MVAGACRNCGAFVWENGVSEDLIIVSGPSPLVGGIVFCNEDCKLEYEVDNDVAFD